MFIFISPVWTNNAQRVQSKINLNRNITIYYTLIFNNIINYIHITNIEKRNYMLENLCKIIHGHSDNFKIKYSEEKHKKL